MSNLSKQLGNENSKQESNVGRVGNHNSGQMGADASDQIGTTPVAASQDEISKRHNINKDDIRDGKVDPEAVRESFKEAELDTTAETEPEEGEDAA